jgi:uncharacterized damage-inducible protein DinB
MNEGQGRSVQTGASLSIWEGAMRPEEMVKLFEYNAWADRRAVKAVSALSTEKFNQKTGSSFSSVRDTLVHVFGAERLWFARFQGGSPKSFPDGSSITDPATLQEQWSAFEPEMLAWVRGLNQEDLDRVMVYQTMKFGEYSNPLWQMMQHMVNHGTYHRGQITTMLRQLGAEPISTDLMHYYREINAAAKA